ncbi:MAG: hypothetical protein PQJ49_10985 [Sphaerochaetaceae bacterium]|jgi:hypothetical protein|nr:hypothetical protein [Sphaerochaetaceae bacterium]
MLLKTKKEIFVKDLDKYYKNKKYQDELIGLYEPDYEIWKFKFNVMLIQIINLFSILSMPKYNKFTI